VKTVIYFENTASFKLDGTCVMFGAFNGFHLGHKALVSRMKEEAAQGKYTSVVLSFDTEPFDLLYPGELVLDTKQEKAYQIGKQDPDVMISYPFTEATKAMSAEQFLQEVLLDRLGTKVLVIGRDYKFGRDQEGDLAFLEEAGRKYGFKVVAVDMVKSGQGELITHKLLYDTIESGDMERLHDLLGHYYTSIGIVGHGMENGRKVGMPTANQVAGDHKKLVPLGVYATLSFVNDGLYKGLTNIGKRPSVDDRDQITIESFIFDFCQDIYGKTEILEVCKWIRGTQKFANLEEVKQQVNKDIENIHDFFEKIDLTKREVYK